MITVENKGESAANAVIKLNSNDFDYSKAKTDGADIRFAGNDGKLKGDGLSYWIEEWNKNGESTLWVKVPKLTPKGKTLIYLLYGNTAAKPVSNGKSTFLFFDDFEDGDYTRTWTNVSIGEIAEKDGMLKLRETDGQVGMITTKFNITGKMIIRTLYQRGGGDEHWTAAGIGGWNYWFCFGDHTEVAGTGTNYAMIYDGNSINELNAVPLIKVPNKTISDKWRKAAFWYDGTNLKGMQDDTIVEWPAVNAPSKLALRTLDNDSWDNFDYITVSAYTEATVTTGQEIRN